MAPVHKSKYSPFRPTGKVHPGAAAEEDGPSAGAAGGGKGSKAGGGAEVREDYAREVQYYKDLLAGQETGLLFCRTTLLINPKGAYMSYWDCAALVALILTAIATPFEISFVRFSPASLSQALRDREMRRWFLFNRAVDGVFFVDMVQTFFIPFRDPKHGGRLRRRERLQRRVRRAGDFGRRLRC